MKKGFLVIVSILAGLSLFSQTTCPAILFTYDAAGNRLQRTLGVVPCRIINPSDKPDEPAALTMQFHVYPNPTQDKVNIELVEGDATTESKVLLYDVNGKVVYSGIITSTQLQIDVSALTPGTYLLQITRGKEYAAFNVLKN